jgi:excisionase family DNA binding protein
MPPKRKSETSAGPGPRTPILGEEVYTTAQVAYEFHKSVRTILRAIHSGKLQARRVGKEYLITRSAARAYYEGSQQADRESINKEG